MTLSITRRRTIAAMAGALAPIACRSSATAASPVRLSYQESSVLLQVLRNRAILEPRLQALGFTPVWSQLGHSLAELGQVDFQGDVAEAVPVMIHQKLPNLILYAAEGPSPRAAGIVVRNDGGINGVPMLNGKRVGVAKGGSSFDLLLRSLHNNGMSLANIEATYLPEAASSAAFSSGHLDAWATYDPFLSSAETDPRARLLTDGGSQGLRYDRYYMVDAGFARAHPQVVKAMFDALVEGAAWIRTHPDQATTLLSGLWQNMPLEAVRRIDSHRNYSVRAIDNTDIPTLQQIAGRYRAAGVLPMDPDVASIGIWKAA